MQETSEKEPLIVHSPSQSSIVPANKKFLFLILGLIVVLIFLATLITSLAWAAARPNLSNENNSNNPSITHCPPSNFPLQYNSFYSVPQPNPPAKSMVTLLKNASIWTGNGNVLVGYDIKFENGLIVEIAPNIGPVPGVTFILNGAYVTPGLIDIHSHIGIDSFPEDVIVNNNANEVTNPTYPQLRVIDGIDPLDRAIDLALSGGVTTSLVLPGSANVMGGEGAPIKLRGHTVGEMLIPNAPRSLKMACGENPMMSYGYDKGETPETRMGVGWKFRDLFYQAAKLKQLQNQWDCLNAQEEALDPRPEDISLEPLIGVLNHEVKLNIHCYLTQDFETVIRTAKEFNFSITAFHHASDAYKIIPLLQQNHIAVALFADSWAYKWEAYDTSVLSHKKLTEAGIKVAIKTDHPIYMANTLIFEAGKVHYYGSNEQDVLASITRIPSEILGLNDRIGTLEVGKQADIVVWDRHPFELGASSRYVFIDGNLAKVQDNSPLIPYKVLPQASLKTNGNCDATFPSYAITGVTVYTMNDNNDVQENTIVVVKDGIITCISPTCSISGISRFFEYQAGILIPGLVSVGSEVGQTELMAEEATWDGIVDLEDGFDIFAVDGVHLQSLDNKVMKSVTSAGINTIINAPQGTNLIAGIGVAYYSRGFTMDDALISSNLSLHIHIGNDAKRPGITRSISGQFAHLRQIFRTNELEFPFIQIFEGNMPVVAHVNQMDQIVSLLRLKRQFGFNLIIHGGAEAHLVANKLAEENVGVILFPGMARIASNRVETWKYVSNAITILSQANVTVGLSIEEIGDVRNLIWEAGLAHAKGLDYMTSIASVTKNPAKLFGIYDDGVGSIQVGQKVNLVGYPCDPLSFQCKPQIIAFDEQIECFPSQY